MDANAASARQHWENVYAARDITPATPDDGLAKAAMAHFGDVESLRILDLGCGSGEYSLFFAASGADVTAVDYSEVAIQTLAEYCDSKAIHRITPVVVNAFDISDLGTFDAVFGSMILHHLEPFPKFVDVLHSAVAPQGKAFFYENNAMSKTLVWCREHLTGHYGIPKFGDGEEFPLTPNEIDELRRRFIVQVTYPEMLFARMASAYLLRWRAEQACEWIDSQLYRFERLRRYSYHQYVLLTRF
jgi:SAM-dependent methyltransferase